MLTYPIIERNISENIIIATIAVVPRVPDSKESILNLNTSLCCPPKART